jgi:hypothetical protein
MATPDPTADRAAGRKSRGSRSRKRHVAGLKPYLRRAGLTDHVSLHPVLPDGAGSSNSTSSWPVDPSAALETFLRNVEKGCRAALETVHAVQARTVLALYHRAREECLGEYAVPLRAAHAAAALAEAYERLKISLVLGRPGTEGRQVRDGSAAVRNRQQNKRELEAELQFYRQRFAYYSTQLPQLSNAGLLRLAAVDARKAGWPDRPDKTHARWTLDLARR